LPFREPSVAFQRSFLAARGKLCLSFGGNSPASLVVICQVMAAG